MSVLDKIKDFFSKLFKKQDLIEESPVKKEEKNKDIKNIFEDSLKVNIEKNKSNIIDFNKRSKVKKSVIESLVCDGDGTGIQKIKKY